MEHARQWAIRCVHESQLYERNCFITLTYEEMPADKSLDVREFQLFLKKFRKAVSPTKIRFFHCGEYGAKYGRPHYHALIFNYDFDDKKFWKKSPGGSPLFISEKLSKLWGLGYTSVGAVTFKSASYVARYILKKVSGPLSNEHYQLIDPASGEVTYRKPEYTTMSRRPGIARDWYNKYKFSDCYDHDEIIMNGTKMRPPSYYDEQFEHDYPEDYDNIIEARVAKGRIHQADTQPDRLRVREAVHKSKIQQLKRGFS